jgi:hypothetical protein
LRSVLADTAGLGLPVAMAGMTALAVLVAAGMRAAVAPRVPTAAVCLLQVVTGGATPCGRGGPQAPATGVGKDPLLHFAQDAGRIANRPDVERAARPHEEQVAAWLRRSLTDRGRSYQRPVFRLVAPLGGTRDDHLFGRFTTPVVAEAHVPDSGDPELDRAKAIYGVLVLYALATQTIDFSDPEQVRRGNDIAECMVGVYASWAGREPGTVSVDPATVERFREILRSGLYLGEVPADERLEWFDFGRRNGQRTANPFDACEASS